MLNEKLFVILMGSIIESSIPIAIIIALTTSSI